MELLLLVFVSLLTWSGTTCVNEAEPYVTTLDQTDDWALLQCKVHEADPKPKVQWQDRAGNILRAKEPQVTENGYIILQTTVTKTDYYRCNATYENIKISAETYVHFTVSGSSAGLVVSSIFGPLVVVALGITVLQ